MALRHALDRGFQDRWHVPKPPRESTPIAILRFKFKTYVHVINANPITTAETPARLRRTVQPMAADGGDTRTPVPGRARGAAFRCRSETAVGT